MPRLLKRVRNLVASRLHALAAPDGAESFQPMFEAFDPEDAHDRAGRAPRTAEGHRAEPRARALAILELGSGAGQDEIRSAYRRLCRRYHPDRFSNDEAKSRTANELLVEINRAYEVLTGEG